MIESNPKADTLKFLFAKGFTVKHGQHTLGPGLFEKTLEGLGYTKKELKQLCEDGVLRRTTTRYQGGWRNTYVLLLLNEGKQST